MVAFRRDRDERGAEARADCLRRPIESDCLPDPLVIFTSSARVHRHTNPSRTRARRDWRREESVVCGLDKGVACPRQDDGEEKQQEHHPDRRFHHEASCCTASASRSTFAHKTRSGWSVIPLPAVDARPGIPGRRRTDVRSRPAPLHPDRPAHMPGPGRSGRWPTIRDPVSPSWPTLP